MSGAESGKKIAWEVRGKTIQQLISELESFENKDLEVRISVDDGQSTFPISLVGKVEGRCVMMFCPPY